MHKHAAVRFMLDEYIVAIVRADSGGGGLVNVIEAIAAGGVRCIEVTMTTPGALECIATATASLAASDVLLGAGSVLDAETCRAAILAGAEYIVTPTVSIPAIRMANRYGKPIVAGAFTPTEILTAWEQGADFVKVFPASFGGPEYIKAVKAPMPQVALVPTGGVNLDNIPAYVQAGASAIALGTGLASSELIEARDYAGITRNAKAFADAVRAARGGPDA